MSSEGGDLPPPSRAAGGLAFGPSAEGGDSVGDTPRMGMGMGMGMGMQDGPFAGFWTGGSSSAGMGQSGRAEDLPRSSSSGGMSGMGAGGSLGSLSSSGLVTPMVGPGSTSTPLGL